VDPRRRRELARYGAPAAFLAAATIAVLLIKAGLSGDSEQPVTTVGALPTTTTTQPATTTTKLVLTATTPTTTTAPEGEYYVIQSGDTLGDIALRYDTTVEELMRLNPEVDPTALRPGERIRVS
jgi:LysM repeat protein